MFNKLWKTLPETLPELCLGWNHGLIELKGEIKHGAFVNIYHLHPGGHYFIKPLWAFANKTIYLQLQWGETCSTLERLTELIDDKTILGFPPENAQIVDVSRLVFKVIEIDSRVDGEDIVLEIKDIWKQLANEPDSLALCRTAVRHYCNNPTEENLLNLKEKYFSIPNQRRSFLISMDAKDHLVKQILATEDKNQLQELTVLLKQEIEYSWEQL
jgi:hypothetical protein